MSVLSVCVGGCFANCWLSMLAVFFVGSFAGFVVCALATAFPREKDPYDGH